MLGHEKAVAHVSMKTSKVTHQQELMKSPTLEPGSTVSNNMLDAPSLASYVDWEPKFFDLMEGASELEEGEWAEPIDYLPEFYDLLDDSYELEEGELPRRLNKSQIEYSKEDRVTGSSYLWRWQKTAFKSPCPNQYGTSTSKVKKNELAVQHNLKSMGKREISMGRPENADDEEDEGNQLAPFSNNDCSKARNKAKGRCANVNTPAILGAVPGVEVGDRFNYRVELHLIGLHRPYQNGIDFLGTGNEVSMDNGNVLEYSGQGGHS
ncbi:hypothetical protein GIB67_007321 [Kingdonia uniflora]|uniref:YDG domain-containing protein n=1 Tax=Kingdonia uniflora TaxID=39325 RepID=A0A7J7NXK0_9MAGN|nr:hypothetical protein GIB67_007321 [Kingdonia uniflora]